MRQTTTYLDLSHLIDDIEYQCQQSRAFVFFNREKIKRFYTLNKLRIEVLHKRCDKINKKYTKLDENGNPLMVNNDKNQNDFVYEEEHLKEEHKQELADFLATTFDLEL